MKLDSNEGLPAGKTYDIDRKGLLNLLVGVAAPEGDTSKSPIPEDSESTLKKRELGDALGEIVESIEGSAMEFVAAGAALSVRDVPGTLAALSVRDVSGALAAAEELDGALDEIAESIGTLGIESATSGNLAVLSTPNEKGAISSSSREIKITRFIAINRDYFGQPDRCSPEAIRSYVLGFNECYKPYGGFFGSGEEVTLYTFPHGQGSLKVTPFGTLMYQETAPGFLDDPKEFAKAVKINFEPDVIGYLYENLDPVIKMFLKSHYLSLTAEEIENILSDTGCDVLNGNPREKFYSGGKVIEEGGMGSVIFGVYMNLNTAPPTFKLAAKKKAKLHSASQQDTTPFMRKECKVAHYLKSKKEKNPSKFAGTLTPLVVNEERGEIIYVREDIISFEDALRDREISPTLMYLRFAQVLEALADFHDDGLVHRDIKPSNLMLADLNQVPNVVDKATREQGQMNVKMGGRGVVIDWGNMCKAERLSNVQYGMIIRDANGNHVKTEKVTSTTPLLKLRNKEGAPFIDGYSPDYFNLEFAVAAQRAQIAGDTDAFKWLDYYNVGVVLEQLASSGVPDKDGNKVPAKTFPEKHKLQLQKIIRGLKSYNRNDPNFQLVHNAWVVKKGGVTTPGLGGLRGVARWLINCFTMISHNTDPKDVASGTQDAVSKALKPTS